MMNLLQDSTWRKFSLHSKYDSFKVVKILICPNTKKKTFVWITFTNTYAPLIVTYVGLFLSSLSRSQNSIVLIINFSVTLRLKLSFEWRLMIHSSRFWIQRLLKSSLFLFNLVFHWTSKKGIYRESSIDKLFRCITTLLVTRQARFPKQE